MFCTIALKHGFVDPTFCSPFNTGTQCYPMDRKKHLNNYDRVQNESTQQFDSTRNHNSQRFDSSSNHNSFTYLIAWSQNII